jgi:hypothetical protein
MIPPDKIGALFQNKERRHEKMTTINSSNSFENSVLSAPPAGRF